MPRVFLKLAAVVGSRLDSQRSAEINALVVSEVQAKTDENHERKRQPGGLICQECSQTVVHSDGSVDGGRRGARGTQEPSQW